MTTIAEAYFLVRVGSWDEDDLENYIQERVEQGQDRYYDSGFTSGYESGHEDGRNEMYKQAVETVKCLM